MAYKMIVLALCVASALGSAIPHAAQYPAGVSPHTCPNYPYCDNVALAHGHVAPYAAPIYAAYGAHGAVAHAAAARYPAGVSPHACPNYPFCGPTPAHAVAHPGAWAGGHGDHDDGSYRPWEYETPYAHNDDGQYHHWDHAAGHHW